MPKQSKAGPGKRGPGRPPSRSAPASALPRKELPDKFCCCRCDRVFTKRKGNFPVVQSPIYRGNDGFLPFCRKCVDELFDHYKEVLGDEKEALRRMCLKFDIYWNDAVYAMAEKSNTATSKVLTYIMRANLTKFVGKTFDDTIDEEEAEREKYPGKVIYVPVDEYGQRLDGKESVEITRLGEGAVKGTPRIVTQDQIDFWGDGFDTSYYIELEKRKKYWMNGREGETDQATLAIIRQVCIDEVKISRDAAEGKDISRTSAALNALLGSANLKPSQKAAAASESNTDMIPFGVWINKVENTEPIPDVDPELADVDGIIRYMTVWFLGHLCKMCHINNKYSKLYEDAVSNYTVDKPQYDVDDGDMDWEAKEASVFDNAFANDGEAPTEPEREGSYNE